MHDNYGRLFEPAYIRRRPNPQPPREGRLSRARPRGGAARRARPTAPPRPAVSFPDEAHDRARPGARRDPRDVDVGTGKARGRSHVAVTPKPSSARPRDLSLRHRRRLRRPARVPPGRARCAPTSRSPSTAWRPPPAPTASRSSINSGYRSDAEQAVLWARHPDPKWSRAPAPRCTATAPSSTSARPSAYAWLAANAARFHFLQRYAWEPWHFGYIAQRRSSSPTRARATRATARRACRTAPCPGSCPRASRRCCARAAQRWNVSATLLAAQLYAESASTRSRSSKAGAQGIAQFMPATARGDGARRTRSTPSRRSTRRRTSCATCCGSSARSRSRSRPTTPARRRSRPAGACRHTRDARLRRPDPRPDVAAPACRSRSGGNALEVRLVR